MPFSDGAHEEIARVVVILELAAAGRHDGEAHCGEESEFVIINITNTDKSKSFGRGATDHLGAAALHGTEEGPAICGLNLHFLADGALRSLATGANEKEVEERRLKRGDGNAL